MFSVPCKKRKMHIRKPWKYQVSIEWNMSLNCYR